MEFNDLPEELIEEILRRLSFMDMLKSKSVCKLWKALLSDSTFLQYRRRLRSQSWSNKQPSKPIRLLLCSSDYPTDRYGNIIGKTQLYLSTSNNINKITTIENEDNRRSLMFTLQHKREVMRYMEVISSSFLELVLLYMNIFEPVYLYNPSTKEFLSLPKNSDWDNFALSSMGLGRIDSTNEYKVVRVLENFSRRHCEVFTLGSDDHWRTAAAPPFRVSDDPGVFVAGGLYMFLELDKRNKDIIARFDIDSEEWMVIPPPKGIFIYWGNRPRMFIREVGGLICLIDNSGSSADIWVLKDYKQGIWAMENSIKFSYFSNFFDEEEHYPYLYPLSLDYGDGKVLLMSIEDDGEKLISYDPKIQNAEELLIPYPTIYFSATLFTESLDSLF